MQTTLRLPDDLYRAAKARAAEKGISLTRFLEESIRHHLEDPTSKPFHIPELGTHDSNRALSWEEIKQIDADEEIAKYLRIEQRKA